MAVRKLVINFGQSNSGPWHDLQTWLEKRLDLNLITSTARVGGAYSSTLTMPWKFPGFSGPIQLKGLAIADIRYLTTYNPSQSGYSSYPGVGRAYQSTEPRWLSGVITVWVEQMFSRGANRVASIARKIDGRSRTIIGIASPVQPIPAADFIFGTNTILLADCGYQDNDPVVLTTSGALPTGLSLATTYYVTNATTTDFQLKVSPTGVLATFSTAGTGTHTLTMSEVKTFLPAAVNTATNQITLAAHNWPNGSRLMFTSSGTLPGGISAGVSYLVANSTANTFTLQTPDGSVVGAPSGDDTDITSTGTGTHSATLQAPTFGGCRLRFDTPDFWIDPLLTGDEEFTYAIKANAANVGATVQLNLGFGVRKKTAASLRGVQLNFGGAARIIGDWDTATNTATLHDPANPENTLALALVAGDVVTLTGPGGIAFDRWSYFLPWSLFESDLSANTLGKTNPYPPGFDFPGQFHTPPIYSTDQQLGGTAVEGTVGLLKYSVRHGISWHTSFLVRLANFYGEEVWCISTDFGGTTAGHMESAIGEDNVGWYDKGQQTDWAMSRKNSCFQRWLDELDMAIAAAAAVGDTLKVVGVFRNQGFADATSGSDPTYGPTEDQATNVAEMFLDVNRAFRARCRQELVNRGLWDADAAEIPWIQPLEQQETVDLVIGDPVSLAAVNSALQTLADEDDFAETWDQTGMETSDGIHFTGAEVGVRAEDETFDAFQKVLQLSDRSGEVDICNLALTHIGAAAIVTSISPPDGSAEAAHCATFYKRARNSILEAFNWSFATKRRALFPITSNTSAYDYAYLKPSNAQRLIAVLPPGAQDDYSQPAYGTLNGTQSTSPGGNFDTFGRPVSQSAYVVTQPYVVGQLDNGTEVIYTDQPEAHLRYVERVANTRRYPELFRLAVSWQLAGMLAGPIIKGQAGAAMADRCMRMAMMYVSKAGASDGNQQKVEPEHTAPWMSARL